MSTQSKRILIIDDDTTNNFINTLIIKRSGMAENLKIFTKTSEAIHFLDNAGSDFPDIILVDINLPVLDGWDFLKHYYKMGHNLRKTVIAMVSSSVFKEDQIKAKSFDRVVEFISKPLTPEKLELVASYCEKTGDSDQSLDSRN
jgi:CheY-like chemotaxis protein